MTSPDDGRAGVIGPDDDGTAAATTRPPHADGRAGALRSTVAGLRAAAELAWSAAAHKLALRVGLAAAAGLLPIGIAWLTKTVFDRLTGVGGPVLAPILLLAAAGAAAVVLPAAARYADNELHRAIGLTARRRLYAAVGEFTGLARFENPRFHDRLSLAADTGGTGPAELVGSGLGAAQAGLTAVAFLASLAVLNPWLLLVAALAAVPTARAELRLARHRAQVQADLGPTWRREYFYASLLTSVTAAKEVRLFGLGRLFAERMVAELRRINAGQRRVDRRELYVQALHGVLGAAVAGTGLVWAAYATRAGQLSIGDLALLVAAIAGVQSGLSAVVTGLGTAHAALLLFAHYRHVVGAGPDQPTAGPDRPAAAPGRPAPVRPASSRGIELDDVWFRYAPELPWVLRGVHARLPAGSVTALVGANGTGKSTLVKLLCRFYDPTRGAIRWDGVDLRELPVAELRARIGALFQDFMAYELSAAENIGVGDPPSMADRDRLVAAARLAGSHDTLAALPRGYDTMLTRIFVDSADRADHGTGVVLSGGQWQRLALARALLRRADLLILDEPSAGLDAEAEAEVHRRLREYRAGRTSLLISHRLAAVRDADRILVLDGGVVVEDGGHDELLLAGGRYARLFRLQASGYQESADLARPAPR